MDDAMQELNFSQMPKWFQINETVIVPSLENTMNEMRTKILDRHSNASELWRDGRTGPFDSIGDLFRDEAIAFAIRRYGLRPAPPLSQESDNDHCPPTQAKKMRTDHGTEDDIVASAIESAIAEKGLR